MCSNADVNVVTIYLFLNRLDFLLLSEFVNYFSSLDICTLLVCVDFVFRLCLYAMS